MSRRAFVRLVGIGGAASILGARWVSTAAAAPAMSPATPAATAPAARPMEAPVAAAQQAFFKSEEPLLKISATGLGTRWDRETSFITPHEHFFVVNRYPSPAVDAGAWRLRVTGDAVERPMEFTYDDILRMPGRHAIRYHECFGNGRTVAREQLGYTVRGGNWAFAAASQGEWDYVPIAEILDRVKPRPEAAQLLFWSGVDGPDTGRPIPMAEVLARPEVIGLAYGLNGLALPGDHGFPVRALVPGWAGTASVKWLTEINISTRRFWTRMHTREDALIGPDYPPERPAPDDEFRGVAASDVRGITATRLNVKSWLALPSVLRNSDPPGNYPLQKGELPTLPAGRHIMRGYAVSPSGIQRLEYSADGGSTWEGAALLTGAGKEYTWAQFEFAWEATAGTHVLKTRATDMQGNTQPETVPFDELGGLCNAIPRFEAQVT